MSLNTPSAAAVPGGRIEVAESAVVTIVREAVIGSYGIVDLAPRSLGSSLVHRLGFGTESRGINVVIDGARVSIDVSVVVEYGTPIFTVASNVMQTVTFHVERTLGMDVERVNVNVDALHVTQPSRKSR
ncbi:MAG: Asp23/Gls24 family envelope stress response protein [Chloroflexia bacterium]|nr:Asp23/Gls24 family envelope stress response protein [Chloroflexia bacterium]